MVSTSDNARLAHPANAVSDDALYEANRYGVGVYIGMDCTHATVRKRIFAMQAAGVDVKGFTFRRKRSNADYVPEWDNVDLGLTEDRNYGKRVLALKSALGIMLEHKQVLREAKYIYARNFDNILLGLAAKRLSGSKAKLVYEVPDVQEFFFGNSPRARLFRGLERRVLARIDLVVASSPGFIRGYFEPAQGYQGRTFIWENKLLADQMGELPSEDALNAMRERPDPWILSWHGTLRCPESMKMLAEIARRLGPRIKIYMRGKPVDYPELFENSFQGLENAEFGGEYALPDDLTEIYGPAHFAWCLDYFDADGNSPLLLPNRLYQGGYMGVVPLADSSQETGHFVDRESIGWTFSAPLVDNIVNFFENLTWDDYQQMRKNLFARRDDLFMEDATDIKALLSAIDSETGT